MKSHVASVAGCGKKLVSLINRDGCLSNFGRQPHGHLAGTFFLEKFFQSPQNFEKDF
jgi:hypothetical protein